MSMFVQVRNKVEQEVRKILGEQLQIYTQLTGWDIVRWPKNIHSPFLRLPYIWGHTFVQDIPIWPHKLWGNAWGDEEKTGVNQRLSKETQWRTTLHEYTEKSMNTLKKAWLIFNFLSCCWFLSSIPDILTHMTWNRMRVAIESGKGMKVKVLE